MRVPMAGYAEEGDGVLVTRETGARARFEIERQIAAAGPGAPVALDFDAVRAISVPFADECVGGPLTGRLVGGYYDADHPVVAVNATEDVRETLALTLANRRLSLLFLGEHKPELLGGDRMLTETLEAAHRLEQFSANDLAKELHVTPQAANNRLKALVMRGALKRARVTPTRGGREFAYEVVRRTDLSGPAPYVGGKNGRRGSRSRRRAPAGR